MLFINLIGNLIGFAIFCLIIWFIIKHKGNHPDIFKLQDGEEIIKMAKGDYWTKELVFRETQNSGEFAFTNKRVLFKGTYFASSNIEVSIPYEDIANIKPSFVMIFPVAFTIVTKDNKEYKFAILKRHIYMDLIKSLSQKSE